jgi:aminopeptidase N
VPFDGSGFVIRYYKGSLMLDYLRHALGDGKFFQDSRDFFQAYNGKSIGTAEFRGFWKARLGDQKDLLDLWLDSTGGLPQLTQKQATAENSGRNDRYHQQVSRPVITVTDTPQPRRYRVAATILMKGFQLGQDAFVHCLLYEAAA